MDFKLQNWLGGKKVLGAIFIFAPLLLDLFALNPFAEQTFAELQLTRLKLG